jgi:hypothetical protein
VFERANIKWIVHDCFESCLVLYLVTIFILNTFVYKRLHASGRTFPIKARMIIGLISAAFSMVMAGTVEILRQNISIDQNFTQTIG